eukprot:scaffold7.g3614.t1
MADQVVYLETFVESTTSLPPELQRILNTIKDLDERSEDAAARPGRAPCLPPAPARSVLPLDLEARNMQNGEYVAVRRFVRILEGGADAKATVDQVGAWAWGDWVRDLAAQIQDNVELVLAQPAAGGGGRRAGGGAADEVADLRARVDADQRLLVQFAEEKVQLAVAGYDLLDSHLAQLDIDIRDLGEELAAVGGKHCCQTVMGLRTYGALGEALGDYSLGGDDDPAFPASSARRNGGGGRLRDVPSFDSLDPSAVGAASELRRRSAATAAQVSLSGLEGGATPAGGASGAPAAAGGALVSGLGEAYAPPRRQRAAAVAAHVAAAAVAAMEEEEGVLEQQPSSAAAHPQGGAVALPPFVAGLAPAAPAPQASGRLLNAGDICESLVGRVAELFWPADNNWYLIRRAAPPAFRRLPSVALRAPASVTFQSVDLAARRADILYNTGEQESLSLDDIQRDGHCSLIS